MKHIRVETIMAALLLVLVFGISREAGILASGQVAITKKERPVVAIDVGHPTTSLGTENKVRVGGLDLREGDLASVWNGWMKLDCIPKTRIFQRWEVLFSCSFTSLSRTQLSDITSYYL